MKPLFKVPLIFAVLFLINACNQDDFKKDMVLFDKAFIPALYYIYLEDLDKAEFAFQNLKSEWNRIQDRYTPTTSKYKHWSDLVIRLERWMEEAECAIKDGEVKHAFVQLDHVRYEWMDLRYRKNMETKIDYIWDFDAALDIAVETAHDPMIELYDWKEFVTMNYEVADAWETLSTIPTLGEDLLLTNEEVQTIKEMELKMEHQIEEYLEVVYEADLEEIRTELIGVRNSYLDYLKVFGDFDAALPIAQNKIKKYETGYTD